MMTKLTMIITIIMKKNRNKKISKYRKSIKKQKGGYLLPHSQISNKQPNWRIGRSGNAFTTLVQISIYNHNTNARYELPVYGSSLPSSEYFDCYATLSYYFYSVDIKRILSLHACKNAIGSGT